MSGWRDIATAPKDEDILVFSPDARAPGIIVAALLTFVSADDPTDIIEDWHDVWMETNLDVEPTHWMPLPNPPEHKE